ncbi:MAG: hypothetical protein LBV50_11525 [Novosphingobium sp.]|jgi:hypothetical protein|nr:hypothetical protein [Novosphingobium sp.]
MKNTYSFEKENGIFICYLNYEDEDDFRDFLNFVCQKLGLPVPEITEAAYATLAVLGVEGISVTASYNTDTGCYLHFPLGCNVLAKKVIQKCYGSPEGADL